MINNTKPFDQQLYDDNDSFGRDRIKNYFESFCDIKIIDHPNQFGIDLDVVKDNKVIGHIEVERRHSWKTNSFPFDTLHVPWRKKDCLTKQTLPTWFASINKAGTRAFFCKADVVAQSPTIVVPNKEVEDGEIFYDVPVDKLELLYLDE